MPAAFMSFRPLLLRAAVWDWPTLGLTGGVVVIWALALTLPQEWSLLSFALLVFALTLHSSLSHEFLHGHPFGNTRAETALGLWQPGLLVPYLRFRRQHLAHHRDANLTDPYDDPESNYLAPDNWARLPRWSQAVLTVNNTLAGRIVVGPAVGMFSFVRADIKAARAGAPHVVLDWLLHLPGVLITIWAVSLSTLNLATYLLACYCTMSVLKIRTFLEHQAHMRVSGRTVIIEDRGILGFLFLNNNLHVVHHMHPRLAWYRLWPLYHAQKQRFITRNSGYVFASYGEVFRKHLWRGKDTVAHPHWRMPED
jgi:fatty acid desaturase